MSAPGFLSAKNVTDIQNNNMEGSTTWKHQYAYTKMIIACCVNQAKRIIQKFDAVLNGAKPEALLEVTHKGIRETLQTPEGHDFFHDVESTQAV